MSKLFIVGLRVLAYEEGNSLDCMNLLKTRESPALRSRPFSLVEKASLSTQAFEYSLGNHDSSTAVGKRNETGVLGVDYPNNSSAIRSFKPPLAVRSGEPVIRGAAPRSNCPRISTLDAEI